MTTKFGGYIMTHECCFLTKHGSTIKTRWKRATIMLSQDLGVKSESIRANYTFALWGEPNTIKRFLIYLSRVIIQALLPGLTSSLQQLLTLSLTTKLLQW